MPRSPKVHLFRIINQDVTRYREYNMFIKIETLCGHELHENVLIILGYDIEGNITAKVTKAPEDPRWPPWGITQDHDNCTCENCKRILLSQTIKAL